MRPMDSAGDGLVIEVLERFGEVRMRVTGTSMVPSVWPKRAATVRWSAPPTKRRLANPCRNAYAKCLTPSYFLRRQNRQFIA